jgi:phenylacetate-coenzyme A ligase PaaK-like adenylate-forming protein
MWENDAMLSFEKLAELAVFATSAKPRLYRSLYGLKEGEVARVTSMRDWHNLPILTKDIIQNEPFSDRIFCPLSDVDHIRATSGTSGRPPLFCPRTHLQGLDHRREHHSFTGATLSFTVPIMPHWHELFQSEKGAVPRVIVYDPRRPQASIRLAKAAGVDHLCLFTFHMPRVCEFMEREGIGSRVRLIEIAGESCSASLFHEMRRVFPNAEVFSYYGASEIEDWPIGMACAPLSEEDPSGVYHGKNTHYLELVDPETGAPLEPKEGMEGDLLISAFPAPPRSFPLIRYRIGDRIRIVGYCDIHETWSYVVLGRSESDFIKIPGGVLRADEIERVLRSLGSRVSDRFTLHRFDRQTSDGVRVEVVLQVQATGSLEELARDIAQQLRVNPVRTYADGVKDGMYLPLKCESLSDPTGVQKHKRMVHHALP